MPTFSNFLKQLDMFGVSLTQEYTQGQSVYKSKIGGLATLIVYLLSIAYGFYILALWFEKSITPKISNESYTSEFQLLNLDYDLIKISYWKYGQPLIDPFKNNILSAHLFVWQGYLSNSTQILKFNYSQLNDNGAVEAIPKINITFQEDNNGNFYVSSDFYIYIGPCIQEELDEGQQCASQDEVDNFFAQPMNSIQIDVKFKRIRPMTGEEQIVNQSYYLQFEDTNCQTQNMYLKTKMYEVKDSLFYRPATLYEFVDDVVTTNQVNTLEYCQRIFKQKTYATIYLNLDNKQILTTIEFSNIGELLANISSIVSMLFLSRFAILKINTHYMEQHILNQLISYYYPEYENVIVTYGWRNQILSVKQGDKLIDIDDFKKFRNKNNHIMRNKMTMSNIMYELSRMEIAFRSLIPIQKLYKTHKCGIRLRLLAQDGTSFELQSFENDEQLKDDDVEIFSIEQRNQERFIDNTTDFFDLNRIDN